MRFKVTGTFKRNGKQVVALFDAGTEEEAAQEAMSKGIDVASVEMEGPRVPGASSTPSGAPSQPSPTRPQQAQPASPPSEPEPTDDFSSINVLEDDDDPAAALAAALGDPEPSPAPAARAGTQPQAMPASQPMVTAPGGGGWDELPAGQPPQAKKSGNVGMLVAVVAAAMLLVGVGGVGAWYYLSMRSANDPLSLAKYTPRDSNAAGFINLATLDGTPMMADLQANLVKQLPSEGQDVLSKVHMIYFAARQDDNIVVVKLTEDVKVSDLVKVLDGSTRKRDAIEGRDAFDVTVSGNTVICVKPEPTVVIVAKRADLIENALKQADTGEGLDAELRDALSDMSGRTIALALEGSGYKVQGPKPKLLTFGFTVGDEISLDLMATFPDDGQAKTAKDNFNKMKGLAAMLTSDDDTKKALDALEVEVDGPSLTVTGRWAYAEYREPIVKQLEGLARAFKQAKVGRQGVDSTSRLRSLAQAMQTYAQANDRNWPDSFEDLKPYVPAGLDKLLANPLTGDNPGYEYVKPERDALPPRTIVIYQTKDGKRQMNLPVAYMDGSVRMPENLAGVGVPEAGDASNPFE